MTLTLQVVTELPGEGGLARPLQAREHDDGRRILGELQAPGLSAEDADELLVDDLDDLLPRVQGLGHLDVHGALFDAGAERPNHG